MKKAWYISRYEQFRKLLVEARKSAGITQSELAAKLKMPQSFVSKYERGERRLDVVEFLAVSEIIGLDPNQTLSQLIAGPSVVTALHRRRGRPS